MVFSKLFLMAFFVLCSSVWVVAQSGKVRGSVQNAANQQAMDNASVNLGEQKTTTNELGEFQFESVPFGTYQLQIVGDDFVSRPRTITLNKEELDLGTLFVTPNPLADLSSEDLIPSVSVSEDDDRGGDQSVAGLLTASRDVFVSTTSFVFGPMRFRLRGYDQKNTSVYLNGVSMNDLENGNAVFSLWGGLNDVMRSREITYGLQPLAFAFGGVGGSSFIDARASKQRKQLRVGYSITNRAYTHRLMATYNTGLLKNGWAFSFSASRRWANEGYVEGTYYDSWSYYAAAEKRINNKHSLALTIIGTPTARGGNTASFQESYDIMDNNYYNSQWGYQNGEKRNARVTTQHQPLAILTHEWKIDAKSLLTTAASFQFGRYGVTSLDWYDAYDPRPDYYRNLPSYYYNTERPTSGDLLSDFYASNPDAMRIQWDNMYDVNRNSLETIQNANGIAGNDFTGNRSRYVILDRRSDIKKFNFNTFYQNNINDQIEVNAGLSYQWQNTHYYQVIDDLLGGDFYVNVDRFAERDSAVTNPDFAQNNLDQPNQILKKGDKFGYNYNSQVHTERAWGQVHYRLSKFDAFAAVELSNTTFWREGNVRNGKYPENSLGKSDINNFFNYNVKAGVTYKLDGRNYFFANASYGTRAPYFRDSYIAARVRDQKVPDLTSEKIASLEGGYLHRGPRFNARATGYITQFKDQFYNRSFFLDNAIRTQDGDATGGFVNYIMKNMDKRHAGVELAVEGKITSSLTLKAVAAIGQAIYTNRPDVTIYLDNSPEAVLANRTVYLKNYNVSAGPQQAYTAGINYNGKKFYYLTLNFNYYANNWYDVNPDRRTLDALATAATPEFSQNFIDPSSELGQKILGQQKAPNAFTVDFFGGKSFRFKGSKGKTYFLYLNAGVNNIFNNKNVVAYGYEQLRYDYEGKNADKYPNRLSYNFGTNFFISASFRM